MFQLLLRNREKDTFLAFLIAVIFPVRTPFLFFLQDKLENPMRMRLRKLVYSLKLPVPDYFEIRNRR